jgi:hypothetical protein
LLSFLEDLAAHVYEVYFGGGVGVEEFADSLGDEDYFSTGIFALGDSDVE